MLYNRDKGINQEIKKNKHGRRTKRKQEMEFKKNSRGICSVSNRNEYLESPVGYEGVLARPYL
jgi:hypothetical protein